jgi:hypothetical protein
MSRQAGKPRGGLRARIEALTPDNEGEELLRDQVLQTLDLIAALEADVREKGVSVRNARGAVAVNPSITALAGQRKLLAILVGRLFPAQDTRGQRQARLAANARWGRR